MTTAEFNTEFDILYDSIASEGAPELDAYEKSVFLTKAQLELIKEYNSPLNKYRRSFEGSDKRRVDLQELIQDYSATPVKSSNGVSDNSFYVDLPSNIFLIKYEKSYISKEGKEIGIDTVPIKYDEYQEKSSNPFRRPDNRNVMRLDMSGNRVELVTTQDLIRYQIRYVKYPSPIVIADLNTTYGSETLTVDGVFTKTECELNQEIHREILDRAVQLAMLAYKQDSLSAKVQLDNRKN